MNTANKTKEDYVLETEETYKKVYGKSLPSDLECPNFDELSDLAVSAWADIVNILIVTDSVYTGGCKTFYSPKEWKDRKEEYATDSELVIVHDGGEVAPFFNWDYEDTFKIDLGSDLGTNQGWFVEGCTCWYSAVYKL